jgi:hypothetical protein
VKRQDGRKLKTIGPFDKMFPYLVPLRSEAQVFMKQTICTDPIDAYIQKKRKEGLKISYLHVFIAVYLRVVAQRPKLNRFVINSQIYARKGIYVSMVVKQSLLDRSAETTVKFGFSGHENINEVVQIVNRIIKESKNAADQADVDRLIARIMSMPGVFKKILISFIISLDKHNLLPRSVLEVSPFHSTLFLTYLKSINTGYVYHHFFNIGTSGIFVALGKVEKMPIVENDALVIRKCCEIGYTIDDRICDGLYLANSFKLVKKYLKHPELLETGLAEVVEDVQ